MSVAGLDLEAPAGAAWEFLVLFLVVILGPPLVERARVPGLIGLLLGGFLIGDNGLGLLDSGSTTIPDLGELGLLYLMFVAGLELDLNLLRRHQRSAVGFGLITFAFPMAFGTAVGVLLDWELAASLLLGSLLASHTLVLYPLIRRAGLANDPIIASAVGATVLTDTIALITLAVIAGTTSGTGSSAEIALQLVLGLVALWIVCFVLLPPIARRAINLVGREAAVRYVIVVAAFLIAAVVAQTFGIEGIVGAFFAGLGMNRLVPNEGPLMGRIDFFGTALFVPVFLVSIGLLLNPSVMVEGETLGLAGLFIVACLGGKMIAAQLTRPMFGATSGQALLAFSLTVPQAAATLAATSVGYEIGLFGESVVNAVLILIFASILIATLVAETQVGRVERPGRAARAPGERVLVSVLDVDAAPGVLQLAQDLAAKEGGVVEAVLLREPEVDRDLVEADLERLHGVCVRLGLETEPTVRITADPARSMMHAAIGHDASLVFAAEDGDHYAATLERLGAERDESGTWLFGPLAGNPRD
jgi:Kef-type K+ transport system membrane component KefB